MEQNKTVVFEAFAAKARERLEERKKLRTRKLHIKELDQEITIRALTDQEVADCNEFSEDSNKNDSYLIYMASKELQEVAALLVADGSIKQQYEVVNILSRADKREIATQILDLSGFYEESTVEVIKEGEAVKNS